MVILQYCMVHNLLLRRAGRMTRQSTDGGGGRAGTTGRWWGYVGGASVAMTAWPWWVGHPGGCGNMVYRNIFHIIWYNITILWYGNIAILYGTQLIITYNTVGLRRISFFSEICSPRSVTNLFAQTRPPPPQKHPPWRSPYRLVNDQWIKKSNIESISPFTNPTPNRN